MEKLWPINELNLLRWIGLVLFNPSTSLAFEVTKTVSGQQLGIFCRAEHGTALPSERPNMNPKMVVDRRPDDKG